MKRIINTLLYICVIITTGNAEMLTAKYRTIKYTIDVKKTQNLEFTFTHERITDIYCHFDLNVFDSDNKKLLKDSNKGTNIKESFNLPVKLGTYYVELSGCQNKQFNFNLLRINGNFEQEPNNTTSDATLIKELKFYYGYLQKDRDKYDYFKINITENSLLKLVFNHKNIGKKDEFKVKIFNSSDKVLLTEYSSLNTKGFESYIGIKKGDYFIRIESYMNYGELSNFEYSLAYVMTKSDNIELEDNDKSIYATQIKDGVYITGYYQPKPDSHTDQDYYSYVATKGKYSLIFEHESFEHNPSLQIIILNENMEKIKAIYPKAKHVKDDFPIDLDDGTYYLLFENLSLGKGEKYRFGLLKNK